MSWLARIRVDFGLASRLRLYDNYAWHQKAWQAFPERDGQPRHFLSRLDTRQEGFELLLLSRARPQRPPWCAEESYAQKSISPNFLDHQSYRFDLRVNPTRKVLKLAGDGKPTKNGRRQALMRVEEQLAWLDRKADLGGFRILGSVPVVVDPYEAHRFRIHKTNANGSHWGVTFRGLLEVVDREKFKEIFHCGIGSAKAFGFGMLLLKPIQVH